MKKLLFACLAFFMAAAAFSQSAKTTGVTDSDVTSFCKNFKKMEADFKKFDVDTSDAQAMAMALGADKSVEQILNKNGISGSNAVDKLRAIAYGYVIARYDEAMAADPEAAALIKSMGRDPMAEARTQISDADQKVVGRHLQELKKVFDD